MEHITNTLKNYLLRETDYALLINGEWGSGKTYYFKNTLLPLINKEKSLGGKLNFQTVYVSLYGIERVSDIQNIIFEEILPFLKHPISKLLRSTIEITIKATSQIDKAELDKKLFDVFKNSKGDNIFDYKSLVICFDDFERRSSMLNFNEILGYINTLIFNNAKVIIIANEKKDPQNEELLKVKEKTIGVTLEFSADVKSTLFDILKSKFKEESDFLKYIFDNQDFISNTVDKKTTNLRNLMYAFDCFLDVYRKMIGSQIVNNLDVNLKDKIYKSIFTFTISISIEYRTGIISFSDLDVFKKYEADDLLKDINLQDFFNGKSKSNNTDDQVSKEQQFVEKYFPKDDYKFFESIFCYITTLNNIFLEEKLEKDIIRNFALDTPNTQEYELIFNKLSRDSTLMSDEEYNQNIFKLKEFLSLGVFPDLIDYLNVYVTLIKYDNCLDFDLDELRDVAISGLAKADLSDKTFDKYIVNEEMKSSKYYESIKPLITHLDEVSKKYKLEWREEKSKILESKLLKQNFDEFTDYEHEYFRNSDHPYFKDFSSSDTAKILLEKNLHFFRQFVGFLEERNLPKLSRAIDELKFYKNLREKFSNEKVSKRKTLFIEYAIEVLDKIISTIESNE